MALAYNLGMDISKALVAAAKKQGWSVTMVAAQAGVSENQARKWVLGKVQPGLDKYMALRKKLPGFAELVDRMVESEVA